MRTVLLAATLCLFVGCQSETQKTDLAGKQTNETSNSDAGSAAKKDSEMDSSAADTDVADAGASEKDSDMAKPETVPAESMPAEKSEPAHLVEVTDKDFQEIVLDSDKPVMVDFWAVWCIPCKELTPIVEKVAASRTDAKVVKVNIDEADKFTQQFKVGTLPALVVFSKGKEVARLVGLHEEAEISEFLSNAIKK